jgi:hypothetical protein
MYHKIQIYFKISISEYKKMSALTFLVQFHVSVGKEY